MLIGELIKELEKCPINSRVVIEEGNYLNELIRIDKDDYVDRYGNILVVLK
jgi:hypothetical protein